MSFAAPQTPQRPLPGAFLQTPAPTRYQSATAAQRTQSATIQNNSTRPQSFNGQQQQQQAGLQIQPQPLLPVQHAAKTINKVLQRDASFPDLDGYIKRKRRLWRSMRRPTDILQREFHLIMPFHLENRIRLGRRTKIRRCMISQM
jgi:nuclear pore complex protein Nup155